MIQKQHMKMKRRKTGEDEPSDEYCTCPDDWKFFLKTVLLTVGCFAMVFILGLVLEIRMRQTHRRLPIDNRNDDTR